MSNDEIVCQCNEVMRSTIVEAIKTKGLTTVEEVQDATDAGTGCGACIEIIEEILAEING